MKVQQEIAVTPTKFWSFTLNLIYCAIILFTSLCCRFICFYSCIDVHLTHLINITYLTSLTYLPIYLYGYLKESYSLRNGCWFVGDDDFDCSFARLIAPAVTTHQLLKQNPEWRRSGTGFPGLSRKMAIKRVTSSSLLYFLAAK